MEVTTATKSKASANGDARIVIPSWERRPLHVTIQGLTPLLCDRIPDHVVEDILRALEGKTKLPREKRDREMIFRDALYVIDAEAGRYGFPTHGFRKSVVCAGKRFLGLDMVTSRGLIHVPDGLFEIQGSEPELSTMSGRNRSKQIIPIVRPLFMPWRMEIELTYTHPLISDEQVVNLINLAGVTVGIGPARVENGMPYGQYEIKEVR